MERVNLRRITIQDAERVGAVELPPGDNYLVEDGPTVETFTIRDVLPDGRVLYQWLLTTDRPVALSYPDEVEVPEGSQRQVQESATWRTVEVYGPDGWTSP